jgi:hypothetical protein
MMLSFGKVDDFLQEKEDRMKLTLSFILGGIVGLVIGIILGKSGLVEAAAAKLAKIRMPLIQIPESPLTEGLRFLLKLPSMNIVAFAIWLLIFLAVAWWLAGPLNVKRIVIVVALAIIWAIISFVIS